MSDKKELQRTWRTNWLGSIQEFADHEAQHQLWLDPTNINPHFSFVEYYCCYFDGLGLSGRGFERSLNEGWISPDEFAAVIAFHRIANTYESPTDDYDHKTILADPQWIEVVSAAKRAQAALHLLNR